MNIKKEVRIVVMSVVSVMGRNPRESLEAIEGMLFTGEKEIQAELQGRADMIYTLSEFMDECNNERFDVDNYFIGWVYVGVQE
jgi:hypothetical protein